MEKQNKNLPNVSSHYVLPKDVDLDKVIVSLNPKFIDFKEGQPKKIQCLLVGEQETEDGELLPVVVDLNTDETYFVTHHMALKSLKKYSSKVASGEISPFPILIEFTGKVVGENEYKQIYVSTLLNFVNHKAR